MKKPYEPALKYYLRSCFTLNFIRQIDGSA